MFSLSPKDNLILAKVFFAEIKRTNFLSIKYLANLEAKYKLSSNCAEIISQFAIIFKNRLNSYLKQSPIYLHKLESALIE